MVTRLHEIEGLLRQTDSALEDLNFGVEQINSGIDRLRDEFSRRIIESEVRTSAAVTSLALTVSELLKSLKQDRDLVDLKSRLPDA